VERIVIGDEPVVCHAASQHRTVPLRAASEVLDDRRMPPALDADPFDAAGAVTPSS
jgi:hypothetical protein